MKTLVVYDSVFGNTEKIAWAIGEALDAKVVRVADMGGGDVQAGDLLIAGSPTRAFRPMPTITEWIKKLPAGGLKGVRVAAFDTRSALETIQSGALKRMMKMFGYAAEPIAKGLAKKGGIPAGEPAGFSVMESEGPLKDGELERAKEWAASLEG